MNREYLAIGVALVVLSLLVMIIRKEKYRSGINLRGLVYQGPSTLTFLRDFKVVINNITYTYSLNNSNIIVKDNKNVSIVDATMSSDMKTIRGTFRRVEIRSGKTTTTLVPNSLWNLTTTTRPNVRDAVVRGGKCNPAACNAVLDSYNNLWQPYNSSDFGECTGCTPVSNPYRIPDPSVTPINLTNRCFSGDFGNFITNIRFTSPTDCNLVILAKFNNVSSAPQPRKYRTHGPNLIGIIGDTDQTVRMIRPDEFIVSPTKLTSTITNAEYFECPPSPPVPRPGTSGPAPRPGTSGPAPRPGTSGPAPRPPTPVPTPVAPSNWTRYDGQVDKYDIVPWTNMPSSGIIGVQQIAENTVGCNVFVIDKNNNKYSLKAINFKSFANIPFINRSTSFQTYARMPNQVAKRAYRINTRNHDADPSVTSHNGFVYLVATNSLRTRSEIVGAPAGPPTTRIITFKRIQASDLTENMFDSTTYISTGIDEKIILDNTKFTSFSSFWAPELFFHNNVCYYIFSISGNDTTDGNSKLFYIYCDNIPNITTGASAWKWGGRLLPDVTEWCIDATLFTIGSDIYLACSRVHRFQYIYVSKMNIDPVSKRISPVRGEDMSLDKKFLTRGNPQVNEAPAYFYDTINRKHMIYFSGDFYDRPEYCLGAFEFTGTGNNILDKSKWSIVTHGQYSTSTILFSSTPSMFPNIKGQIMNLRGTGHNCFLSINGKNYIIYHATVSDRKQGTYEAKDVIIPAPGQSMTNPLYRIAMFQEFTDARNFGGILHSENMIISEGYVF
jgi:GH43 family beta-xylosidase